MAYSMFITQDGPVNALALNRDNTQVVIAGRNVFKIFNIEENEFVENCNLRAGKNLNLSFSCNHVTWNVIEDEILATAATNGAVVVWNLNKPSRSKQDHVFNEHKRTVNKVCFHVTDPTLLLSGSQDGTMKCFDLRSKEVVRIFFSNSESVRDVQFSPHTHHIFTSVSENGNVQLWDLRKHDKHYLQFTAHSGPAFACDWHPEFQWLATASRDKTIKVWDLSQKIPIMEFIIHTIASIGHVKWRPQRRFHIASCSLVVDSNINIWDIRRPYIPFATFDEHKDIATDIAWRGQPHVILSTSRDCMLYQHAFKDALRPANTANSQGVSLNYLGNVACATPVNYNSLLSNKSQTLIKKPSYRDKFCHASSSLNLFISKNHKGANWFVESAKKYLLIGKSLPELCDHNAAVAKELGRHHVSALWNIVKTLYSHPSVGNKDYKPSNLIRNEESATSTEAKKNNGSKILHPPIINGSEFEDKSIKIIDVAGVAEDEIEAEELSENYYGLNTNFVMRSVSDIQNEFQMQGDFFFGDGELDPLSTMDQLVNSFPQEPDWTIQSEAFLIRHEIQESSPQPEQFTNPTTLDTDLRSSALNLEQMHNNQVVVHFLPTVTPINPNYLMAEGLKHQANLGDIQTTVTILFALGEKRNDLVGLDLVTQEHWLLTYLELLARHQLWDVSTEIIQLSWIPSISQLNQQSTMIYTCCGECFKPLQRTGWLCDRCHNASSSICSICHQIVKGLYMWCQDCGHGGHLSHFQKWFKNNKECSAGCGHMCGSD